MSTRECAQCGVRLDQRHYGRRKVYCSTCANIRQRANIAAWQREQRAGGSETWMHFAPGEVLEILCEAFNVEALPLAGYILWLRKRNDERKRVPVWDRSA